MMKLTLTSMPYWMAMTRNILNVSQLVNEIKQTLDFNDSLRSFYLKAELSNFTAHRNGHWYFSLKDERARISAVMFQSYASMVNFMPKEGDQILVRASVSVYAVSGSLQITVFSMENAGLGALYLQFEQLKNKLQTLNYFSQDHKKSIPKFPKRIALVTGANTAALQDLLKTAYLRWPMIDIVLFETLVQGQEAAKHIIFALEKADESDADVIILARGGGSIEDLWAFNDEALALCIYQLKTPIITGIGHESDTTIADFVSDLRAATPTAAMILALPDQFEISEQLSQTQRKLYQIIQSKMNFQQERFTSYQKHPVFTQPLQLFEMHGAQVSILKHRLLQSVEPIRNQNHVLDRHKLSLQHLLSLQIKNKSYLLENIEEKLKNSIQSQTRNQHDKFMNLTYLMDAFSPLKILSRGYGIVNMNGSVVKSIQSINENDIVNVRMVDGVFKSKILGKENKHE